MALVLVGAAIMLSACTATNPLEKAEATPVPGLSMALHAASASENNTDEMSATLYYRYLNQPMLAGEARTLTVKRDESAEFALIQALLDGPSAGHIELRRLFPETVRVLSATAKDGVLYVTFNEALLSDGEIPDDWRERPEWAEEAPVIRRLTLQSLVASLTESFPYTGIQIMVAPESADQEGLRLNNSYFLTNQSGLSDPQLRDESMLLTPQNTAQCVLLAWQQRDFEALYAYTAANENGEAKPLYEAFTQALDASAPLLFYTTSGGSVSQNGLHAVVTVSLALHSEGTRLSLPAYPLPLSRENGVWKIGYDALARAMLQTQ